MMVLSFRKDGTGKMHAQGIMPVVFSLHFAEATFSQDQDRVSSLIEKYSSIS